MTPTEWFSRITQTEAQNGNNLHEKKKKSKKLKTISDHMTG